MEKHTTSFASADHTTPARQSHFESAQNRPQQANPASSIERVKRAQLRCRRPASGRLS